MNYRIHKFMTDMMKLIQEAAEEDVPIYVMPYLLKDIISTLAPTIEQAVQAETPQSEPEWHPNEETE